MEIYKEGEEDDVGGFLANLNEQVQDEDVQRDAETVKYGKA